MFESTTGAIGFVGATWSEVTAAPVAIASLQRLCLHVMGPELAELLEQVPSFEAEALRDAVQGDIEAGLRTPFALLREGF
jgi:hypothetical protein